MNKILIDKNFINEIKSDKRYLSNFLQTENDRSVIFLLNKIGRMDENSNQTPFLDIMESKNEEVRALAIKNLAKFSDISLMPLFIGFAKTDESTLVRREAVSAIGRLRNPKAIETLINFLNDNDPKIVMQAMRGLFVFNDNVRIKAELKKLLDHPNELIRETLQREIGEQNIVGQINADDPSHEESPSFMKNVTVCGDVKDILNYVPDKSIHLTFTSPPYYNARDYSIYQSYDEYLNFLEMIFKEVHRVTKEGRFFILNTSPVIIPRVSRAHSSKRYPIPYDIHPRLVKMGWEFIDDIVWMKPEASVKNRNAGFLQHRKPLAYKPNAITEMVMVYRKKTDKLIDWNLRQYSWEKIKNSKVNENYETTNVWRIDPCFDKVHSAVFPLGLCDRIIKYYSILGDLVFDPFAGSGTVGKSAIKLNRQFFLTEQESKYVDRIKEELGNNKSLFSQGKFGPRFINFSDFISESKKHDNN